MINVEGEGSVHKNEDRMRAIEGGRMRSENWGRVIENCSWGRDNRCINGMLMVMGRKRSYFVYTDVCLLRLLRGVHMAETSPLAIVYIPHSHML